MDCICRAKVCKLEIYKAAYKDVNPADYLLEPGQEPVTPVTTSIKAYLVRSYQPLNYATCYSFVTPNLQNRMNSRIRVESSELVRLVIPGRVLHMRRPEDLVS